MRTESRLSTPTVVKHELVHYLSGMIMPRQPPWLAEGLATFYETLEYDVGAGRVTVGRPSADRLRGARLLGASNIESIFASKTIDPDDISRFYAAAWITTHYLMNHRIEALRGYERALRAGATPEQAWTAAFGTETPRQLALAVRQYLNGGQYELLVYGFKPGPLAAPTVRQLSDADAHATRALLYVTGARAGAVAPALAPAPEQSKAAALGELAEARRQEPAHVMAGAIAHFMLDAPVDADQATAATRAHAGDWLAWMLFAEASRQRGDGAGWNDAVARAVETSRGDRSIQLPFVATPRRL